MVDTTDEKPFSEDQKNIEAAGTETDPEKWVDTTDEKPFSEDQKNIEAAGTETDPEKWPSPVVMFAAREWEKVLKELAEKNAESASSYHSTWVMDTEENCIKSMKGTNSEVSIKESKTKAKEDKHSEDVQTTNETLMGKQNDQLEEAIFGDSKFNWADDEPEDLGQDFKTTLRLCHNRGNHRQGSRECTFSDATSLRCCSQSYDTRNKMTVQEDPGRSETKENQNPSDRNRDFVYRKTEFRHEKDRRSEQESQYRNTEDQRSKNIRNSSESKRELPETTINTDTVIKSTGSEREDNNNRSANSGSDGYYHNRGNNGQGRRGYSSGGGRGYHPRGLGGKHFDRKMRKLRTEDVGYNNEENASQVEMHAGTSEGKLPVGTQSQLYTEQPIAYIAPNQVTENPTHPTPNASGLNFAPATASFRPVPMYPVPQVKPTDEAPLSGDQTNIEAAWTRIIDIEEWPSPEIIYPVKEFQKILKEKMKVQSQRLAKTNAESDGPIMDSGRYGSTSVERGVTIVQCYQDDSDYTDVNRFSGDYQQVSMHNVEDVLIKHDKDLYQSGQREYILGGNHEPSSSRSYDMCNKRTVQEDPDRSGSKENQDPSDRNREFVNRNPEFRHEKDRRSVHSILEQPEATPDTKSTASDRSTNSRSDANYVQEVGNNSSEVGRGFHTRMLEGQLFNPALQGLQMDISKRMNTNVGCSNGAAVNTSQVQLHSGPPEGELPVGTQAQLYSKQPIVNVAPNQVMENPTHPTPNASGLNFGLVPASLCPDAVMAYWFPVTHTHYVEVVIYKSDTPLNSDSDQIESAEVTPDQSNT